MVQLVASLRKAARLRSHDVRIEPFLRHRRILRIEYARDVDYDGALMPLGQEFSDGFAIVLNKNCPSTRIRFTAAHELCHTFFYEYVPELKFRDHNPDPLEERLCDIGAAELLMPSRAVKRQAKSTGTSLEALARLAGLFDVSLDAMLLRLRSIASWHSELSTWRQTIGGDFALQRIVGGRKVDWNWSNPKLLRCAWDTGRLLHGRTYVEYREQGGLKVRPVFYELKRWKDSLLALWSHYKTTRSYASLPLFELASHD
jgi:IrrE N-terminal-like domain